MFSSDKLSHASWFPSSFLLFQLPNGKFRLIFHLLFISNREEIAVNFALEYIGKASVRELRQDETIRDVLGDIVIILAGEVRSFSRRIAVHKAISHGSIGTLLCSQISPRFSRPRNISPMRLDNG